MTEPEWLDIEPGKELTVAEPEPKELEVLDALTVDQRVFVEVLTYCRYNLPKAREIYRDKTDKALTLKTLTRWLVDPKFTAACAKLESLSAQLHGVSKAQVLADLAEIKTRNQGNGQTGDRLALTALEQISKCLGQYQRDEDKLTERVGPALVTVYLQSATGNVVSAYTPGLSDRATPNFPAPEKLTIDS